MAVRHELDGDVDVTVVSASDQFLFNPSLIWLPFGKRDSADQLTLLVATEMRLSRAVGLVRSRRYLKVA